MSKKGEVKFSKPKVAEKHKQVLDKMVENGGKLTEAIRETGLYSQSVIDNPKKITESKTWQEIKEEYLPDDLLGKKHQQLLNSTRIDHMTFPRLDEKENKGGSVITDEEIIAMLAEVNCTVRKIVHGEQARHVYFWSVDNRAVKDALDMGYKLGGKYAADQGGGSGNTTYNFLFNNEARTQVQAMNAVIKNLLIKPKDDIPKDNQEGETPVRVI